MTPEQILVLERVVEFLEEKVDKVESVPGHIARSSIGGCSMACASSCLYQQTKKLLEDVKKVAV